MSQTRKVVISLSEQEYSLLEELSDGSDAEEYAKKLIQKELDTQKLKNGYAEMAQINLELAQMCFDADEQCSQQYEEKLK